MTTISLVKHIDTKVVNPKRAGIIPYVMDNGTMYFALATDMRSGDLTDFAGQVEYYKKENCIQGALREFAEESLGVFGSIELSRLRECRAIYSKKNMIIFVETIANRSQICEHFDKKFSIQYKGNKKMETRDIIWVSLSQFQLLIKTSGPMFEEARLFLSTSPNALIDLPKNKTYNADKNYCVKQQTC